ncbi:MAG TPA: 2-amino-4-hydroxy-6-hydroxymethyldihydropteridine diphosphokinase [Acetobacteraceae bacterium]|nr:2-amino-4-hydroxy-6-hydroxymethyldihydropteridine diphosphokinase [Acetobacteraceae bacterium]
MILVALGANLPSPDGAPPLVSCQRAAALLDALPGLRLRGLSRWWRTAPVPASDQPDYVNGIALLAGEADPAALLRALHGIEARFGRRRATVNAARSLDLDLIDVAGLVRNTPDPVLPHPRAHLRAFVLAPLAEVVPGWVHPRLGRTAEALLADLPAQVAVPMTIQPE